MANEPQGAARDLKNLKMERDRLYLEEVITDLAAGTIRRMTPIKADGTPDVSRATLYMGQAQILSAMGPLPVQFELEADNLEEAVEMFGPEAEKAVRRMVDELRELQREQASQIVVPASGAVPGWRRGSDAGRRPHPGRPDPAHLTVRAASPFQSHGPSVPPSGAGGGGAVHGPAAHRLSPRECGGLSSSVPLDGARCGQSGGPRTPDRENSSVPPALPGSTAAKPSGSAPEARGSESWTTTPGAWSASSRARLRVARRETVAGDERKGRHFRRREPLPERLDGEQRHPAPRHPDRRRPRTVPAGGEIEVGGIAGGRLVEVRHHDPYFGQVFGRVGMPEVAGLPQVLGRVVGEELDPSLGHRAELGAADGEAQGRGPARLGLHLAPERHDRPLREPEGFEARLLRLRVGGPEGEEVDADVPVDPGLQLASDGGRSEGGEDLEVARAQHDAPVRRPDRAHRRAGTRRRRAARSRG